MKMNKFQQLFVATNEGQAILETLDDLEPPPETTLAQRKLLAKIAVHLTTAVMLCEAVGITLEYAADVALEAGRGRTEYSDPDAN